MIRVLLADDASTSTIEAAEPGYGLAGMRERARLYGGHVEAGPRAETHGWRVLATFPLEPS